MDRRTTLHGRTLMESDLTFGGHGSWSSLKRLLRLPTVTRAWWKLRLRLVTLLITTLDLTPRPLTRVATGKVNSWLLVRGGSNEWKRRIGLEW